MYRKVYRIITTLSIALFAVACTDSAHLFDDDDLLKPGDPGTVTISLKNSRMSRSVESDNSENLLSDLAIGLYVAGSDDDALPVVFKTFSGVAASGSTQVVMRLSDKEISDLFGVQNVCRMYVLANIMNNAQSLPANPTVAQMKDLEINANFKEQKIQESFVMAGEGIVNFTPSDNNPAQGSGSGQAIVYRAAAKIALRLRIPGVIEIKNDEGEVTERWLSVTAGNGEMSANPIRALLNNGVDKAVAAPSVPWKATNEDAYYNSDPVITDSPRYFTLTTKDEADDYDIFDMQVPFYTYPNTWEETAEETHKTTITLRVPWQKEGDTKFTTMYYVVPVTPSTLSHIDRNYSYLINMTVGMLGSRTPDTPVQLDNLSYQAVEWADQNIDITIPDTRYLVVNPSAYTVKNENEIVIPYYTSHPAEISNISMTYERFNFYSNGNGDTVHIEIPQEKINRSTATNSDGGLDTIVAYSLEQDPFTKQMILRIKHDLNIWTPVNQNGVEVSLINRSGTGNQTLAAVKNSIYRYVRPENPEDAYSPYYITVHIAHKDNPAFYEDVMITQTPAMYIQAVRNPGRGTTTVNGTTVTGNVFVNNGYGSTGYGWFYSGPLGSMDNEISGDNANPNMYIINVSQFDEGSEYSIGDPRSPFYNNDLSTTGTLATPTQNGAAAGSYTGNYRDYGNSATVDNWCIRASALYPNTNQRVLTYYYPTIEDKDAYKFMVAPKFRVASSYGKTYSVTRPGARRRMATYQELDCPAGRWRLPTYGELQYIISLSSTGKIPVLFTVNSNYWTAQGACTVNQDGTITLTTNTSAYVRGVYDDWFWEKYPQYSIKPTGNNYTYTLGDMPRNP